MNFFIEIFTCAFYLPIICICLNSHKNVQVRKTTSRFVVELVEKMGPGRILSGVKDVTDRVIPMVAQFVMDPSQETRYLKLTLHIAMYSTQI